jgi:N-dimethylarginine dimethylaminohydrolase
MMNAFTSTATTLAAGILLAASLPARADETATLLCNFKHGQLEIVLNYTKGTANGATAIISDKEIIWTPEGNREGMAVINRYTGIMQLSKGRKEFYGSCNKKPE